MSKFKLFDIVVLRRDLPEEGLRAGDTGAIVELFEGQGAIVEFLDEAGDTTAVTDVHLADIRKAESADLGAARTTAEP
ncbi:MAG: DUF4926 domain-containing protein [Dehalococcoidia bacterium]|nr:DUF4926 domain-containing protein [Dehalococcoidia bacterium]